MKPPSATLLSPNIDMTKVKKAVAALTPSAAVRRANAYHDLPPVDQARRRRVTNFHPSHSSGYDNPDFLH